MVRRYTGRRFEPVRVDKDILQQYSYYASFCKMSANEDALFAGFEEYDVEFDEFPKLDFSSTRPFDAFQMSLKTPVVSPFLSHELLADILDIDVEDVENIMYGKAAVCSLDCFNGKYKTGDIVKRSDLLLNDEFPDGNFLAGGYAIAFILYLKEYYKTDEMGGYISDDIPDRTDVALTLLSNRGIYPSEVLMHEIIGPAELSTTLRTRGVDSSDELRYLANRFYSLKSSIERLNGIQQRGTFFMYMVHYSTVQKQVDKLINELINAGMVFKDHFTFES